MSDSTYWVYSVEPMPRVDLFGARDYTPDNDWISFNGVHIGAVPAKTWMQLPSRIKSLRHHDRTDRQGHVYHVFADEIVKANQHRANRGVIFLDHEPTAKEKLTLEARALEANTQFRMEAMQRYEDSVREHDTGNPSRTKPTSYELECYELLGIERPGSVAAFKSQRQPGEAVAERFTAAMEKLIERLGVGGTSATKAHPADKSAPAA
jgi:hypothetical protein